MSKKMTQNLHIIYSLWLRIYKIARLVFVFSALGFLAGWGYSSRLPAVTAIVPEVLNPPQQSRTSFPEFIFDWRGSKYHVVPRAEYSVRGLVVSHNNVGGWTDMYHTSDSVDLKDLCVVWGTNAAEGLYQNVTFWSEPWTCNYRYGRDTTPIDPDELSNNHLLAGTQQIADLVHATGIGDQIEMKGYLVDYYPVDLPQAVRRTSLVRTDTGNGACEVLFLTGFSILKATNAEWRNLKTLSKYLLLISAAVMVTSWLCLPYLEFRLKY